MITFSESQQKIVDALGTPIPDNATVCDIEQIRDEYKTPCSLCRYIDDDSGLCDMCPAMPREKGENE